MGERKRIALIMGTRPEAIKLAPVYRALCADVKSFEPLLWVTGQHRQMLDQVIETFGLIPDRDFDLMQPGQTLTDVTNEVLRHLQDVFKEERPDLIVVQGDTTTVFAAALAAYYAQIPVAHVEAGLRTYDKYAPFPEEMNRQLTSRIADLHFAPTEQAKTQLLKEGVPADRIEVTGNTVIDALDWMVAKVRESRPALPENFPLQQLEAGQRMVLVTGHRRENFGAGFESICKAIATLAGQYPDCLFVYPMHLNPNVREPVQRLLQGLENVHLIEPLGYAPFVWIMDQAYLLLSDSGGIQEEAPHLGKPVLVMREHTERPEAIEAGTSKLVGVDAQCIIREVSKLLDDPGAYTAMSTASNPYGDGHAAQRMVEVMKKLC